jgi:hypothetical protein
MKIVIATAAFFVYSASIYSGAQTGGASVKKAETMSTSIESKLLIGMEYRDHQVVNAYITRLAGLETGLFSAAQKRVGVSAKSGPHGW